jgi:hypothetical protein
MLHHREPVFPRFASGAVLPWLWCKVLTAYACLVSLRSPAARTLFELLVHHQP